MGKDPPHKYDVYLIKVLSLFIKEMIVKNPGFLPKSFPSCNQSWLDLAETLILAVIAKLLPPCSPWFWINCQSRSSQNFIHGMCQNCHRRELQSKLFCNFWSFDWKPVRIEKHFCGKFESAATGRHSEIDIKWK